MELYGIAKSNGDFIWSQIKGTALSVRLYNDIATAKRVLSREKKNYYESDGWHVVKVNQITTEEL